MHVSRIYPGLKSPWSPCSHTIFDTATGLAGTRYSSMAEWLPNRPFLWIICWISTYLVLMFAVRSLALETEYVPAQNSHLTSCLDLVWPITVVPRQMVWQPKKSSHLSTAVCYLHSQHTSEILKVKREGGRSKAQQKLLSNSKNTGERLVVGCVRFPAFHNCLI